ncbi:peptide methionine sulfoxide reductase [Tribonema minus]|uniref:peptide-methionine (S)-S-oxide reductase n=1 Tax=Tribonema minus TaxID=303371 RepID=A0A835YZF7_9STRA|nr:peptide methionine sulfoxide reductase [Tribonema minus]
MMGNSPTKAFGGQAASIVTKPVPANMDPAGTETATFAAGCFWSIQISFDRVPGITETVVGYTDGHKANPTYEEVCSGSTGHTEALQIKYDPRIVSYHELLTVLYDRMDPTTLNRQGHDIGTQYRSGIYYHNDKQKEEALKAKEEAQKHYKEPIVVEIKPATAFYPAEHYHQKYLEKGGQCSRKGDTTAIRCYG